MERVFCFDGKRRRSAGSAAVGLIVVIVLVIAVFIARSLLREKVKDPDIFHDLSPWKEWKFREALNRPPEQPTAEQPALSELLRYNTNLDFQGEPRGELELWLRADGGVSGAWLGQYYKKPKINFDIMNAAFEGRVYPRKIYRDDGGAEDPSRLYFIAHGEFLLAESDFDKGSLYHRGGEIFVRGWIDPDYGASGTVTVTSNRKDFERFQWKALAPAK